MQARSQEEASADSAEEEHKDGYGEITSIARTSKTCWEVGPGGGGRK